MRGATLVSVLAYAGLRPGEAFALTWGSVRERTLLVEAAVSLGTVAETKTRRRRTVRTLKPLAQDRAEWRLRAGRPPDGAFVFPAHDGGPWSPDDWKNWRRRTFWPAAAAAGLTGTRPYDLRHSFVSLLIAEGHNIVEVGRQAGRSPKMALDTYAHRQTPTGAKNRARGGAADAMTSPAASLPPKRAKSCISNDRAPSKPVFGQIKSNRGANRFLRRGRSAVRSEWRLRTLTHNLLKLHRHQLALA